MGAGDGQGEEEQVFFHEGSGLGLFPPFFRVGVAAAVRAVFVTAVQPVVLFGVLADFPLVVGIDAAHDVGVGLSRDGLDFRGNAHHVAPVRLAPHVNRYPVRAGAFAQFRQDVDACRVHAEKGREDADARAHVLVERVPEVAAALEEAQGGAYLCSG